MVSTQALQYGGIWKLRNLRSKSLEIVILKLHFIEIELYFGLILTNRTFEGKWNICPLINKNSMQYTIWTSEYTDSLVHGFWANNFLSSLPKNIGCPFTNDLLEGLIQNAIFIYSDNMPFQSFLSFKTVRNWILEVLICHCDWGKCFHHPFHSFQGELRCYSYLDHFWPLRLVMLFIESGLISI